MTGTVSELALAMLAFLAIHIIPSSVLRQGIIEKIGYIGYMAFFNILSIAIFIWLCFAYGEAPTGEMLWDSGNAGRYLAVVLMAIASILMIGSYTSPNPTVVGGDKTLGTEGSYSGINAISRHPLMWAIVLWSITHLVNNGDITGIIFFGGIGLLALSGTFLIDAKKARQLGPGWEDFRERTSNIPFLAILQGRARFSLSRLWWRILLGLVVFALFFHFHALVIGVSPMPY